MWKIIAVVIGVCVIMVSGEDEPEAVNDEDYGRKCDCRCGVRNEPTRIVGGEEADFSEFPWVARLSMVNKFYCGGTLLNERYVLTAAHCVKGFMWFMIKVNLGGHNRCNMTAHRPITRYVIQRLAHNFTFTNFQHDIAVLKLNDRVVMNNTLMPICLPPNDDKTYAGVNAIAAGWGSIAEQKTHSCELREVELPILTNEECKRTKYEEQMITDGMLCAGYPETGAKDTCQGDSGGALIAEKKDKRYEILGIVSWGIGCGRVGYPGVYTRVTKYLTWIKENTRIPCSCVD